MVSVHGRSRPSPAPASADLTLVDLDEICLTNVNRQLHAMDGQIGRLKTAAMAERTRAINPDCQVDGNRSLLSRGKCRCFLDRGFDAVIDAIDTVDHKSLLLARCHARGTPVVTCGGAGGRRDPTRIRRADLAATSFTTRCSSPCAADCAPTTASPRPITANAPPSSASRLSSPTNPALPPLRRHRRHRRANRPATAPQLRVRLRHHRPVTATFGLTAAAHPRTTA